MVAYIFLIIINLLILLTGAILVLRIIRIL